MAVRITTFTYYVSNSETAYKDGNQSRYYREEYAWPKTTPDAEIDKEINAFMASLPAGETVRDIKINDITINRHNNARADTVKRTYTIVTETCA